MTYWALSALINGLASTILGSVVYLKNRQNVINCSYGIFCLSLSLWSFSYFFWQMAQDPLSALFFTRLLMAFAVFIPISYLHHIYAFSRKLNQQFKLVITLYIVGLIFSVSCFSKYFITSVSKKMWFEYWPDAGEYFFTLVIFWVALVTYEILYIYKLYLHGTVLVKNQIKYVLIATLFGVVGGLTNFPLWFDVPIPPFGNIFSTLYVGLVAYAIFKYRLLDINLALTRAGIFACVYTLVLGIPFYSAYSLGLWKYSLWLMMVLATTGPFIYLYIQKKTEEQLLLEQYQYQTTLKQASLGMGQIKELGRLLKLIVHIVTRVVEIGHSEVYLFHEESGQYTLKASRGWSTVNKQQLSVIDPDSELVNYFQKTSLPVLYDEMGHTAAREDIDNKDEILKLIEQLDGSLVVPSFIDKKLIAILVLGEKRSGKLYSSDDLAVFSILANQAGLAIENAQFYEKMHTTHQQLLKAEKMATVGTMADGLSHQINNRLHAMGFIAGDAIDTIRLSKKKKLTKDMTKLLDEIEHSLSRIEDNVKRGGEIVEGLLKYTRKGSEGFEAIDLNNLLDSSFEMAQFKIKVNEMDVHRNFNGKIPKIKGNFTQLQEVFFNIIDNAYDAMMQRKADLKEEGYQPELEISADQYGNRIEILIRDNGIGVKPENLDKLFTPFFTTKLSSKKGTGLGLYVIRQVIEENHGGRVRFESEYKQGSQTSILLPIAVK